MKIKILIFTIILLSSLIIKLLFLNLETFQLTKEDSTKDIHIPKYISINSEVFEDGPLIHSRLFDEELESVIYIKTNKFNYFLLHFVDNVGEIRGSDAFRGEVRTDV